MYAVSSVKWGVVHDAEVNKNRLEGEGEREERERETKMEGEGEREMEGGREGGRDKEGES